MAGLPCSVLLGVVLLLFFGEGGGTRKSATGKTVKASAGPDRRLFAQVYSALCRLRSLLISH